jgi:DNA-damage-inducible protein J
VEFEIITMSKTSYVTARIEPEIKAQAEAILASVGLNVTETVSLLYRQVILYNGLPFAVRIPNAETLAAIKSAKSEPAGLAKYDSFNDLLSEVDEEITLETK